jgi:hypothetical protein
VHGITKKILSDENMRPIAVQIDYADWVETERALRLGDNGKRQTDLARHVGRLDWPVDGLEYQKEARGEWE